MTAGAVLNPERDLDLGLATANEVNRVIAAADAKAGLVLAAQGVLLAGVPSVLRSGPELPGSLRAGAVVVLAVAGVTVLLLVASLWPRTSGTGGAGWFAIPQLRADASAAVPARPDVDTLAAQAWVQVDQLGAIARSKYRWFRAALVCGAADLLAFTGWVMFIAAR